MIFSISIVFAVAALFFIVVIIRSRLRFVEEMEKSWAEYRKAEQILRLAYFGSIRTENSHRTKAI
jgi:hypothetical protein